MNRRIPVSLSYDDVLLVPQYSEIDSRADVDLSTQISKKINLKIPLISTKMDTVTGVKMAIAMGKLGGMGILPRFEHPEKQAEKVRSVKKAGVLVAAAVGIREDYLERTKMLVAAGADAINIDVAHGHLKKNVIATKKIKDMLGDKITLISGITSTYDCAKDLYQAGADSLLVGIGAGSICTTRIMTGCGVPGFTSLLETARAAKKYRKTFMPDAGIKNSGDIVKALGAGACAIVGGFIFAGVDETPGKMITINGQKFKQYNGSASLEEKEKQYKKMPGDKNKNYVKHLEGVSGYVPARGPLSEYIEYLLAGVRSGFSYCGARNIKELQKKAKFTRVTYFGRVENGAHDITVK